MKIIHPPLTLVYNFSMVKKWTNKNNSSLKRQISLYRKQYAFLIFDILSKYIKYIYIYISE